jgi:hypothetical protein
MNAVGLTQALDEPRDDDDLAAVAVEEASGLLEALGCDEHVAAVAFDQAAAAEVADREPTLSPRTAPTNPSSATSAMLSRPVPTYTAPRIRTVSPGTGTPKSSIRTNSPTATAASDPITTQFGSDDR